MRLQFTTLQEDIRKGLLFSLYGLPIGALFGILCEFAFEDKKFWPFALMFVIILFYTSASEFISEFVTDASLGLTFSVGAMLVAPHALQAPPIGLGLKLAVTYYAAFAIVSIIRRLGGWLPF